MTRIRFTVPVSAPLVGKREKSLASRAIESGWVSSRGPYLEEFERRFARFVGTREGVATTSGTTALHLALATLGIGVGDEVLVPDFTIVACANAVLYTGATPVFVDVDPVTWTMDPESASHKITRRTKAIMPVHIYGHPADMDRVLSIAREHDIAVVEDAAEAHGAKYRGRRVGSIGDIGCFSFYSNKIITTGEGGMIVTQSPRHAARARRLRDLAFAGSRRDYRHSELGFNYRMTNLQAAIGLAQVERADEFVDHRRRCAQIYSELLDGTPGITLPWEAPWAENVYWMYTILVTAGVRRRGHLMRLLEALGVETRVGFWPLHRQKFLTVYAGRRERFPVSTALGLRALSLPSGNGITQAMIRYAARAVRSAVSEAL